jgi:HTH-type transcriptional regulator/antitoxin HigA
MERKLIVPQTRTRDTLNQVYGKDRDLYLLLVRRFPLRPIRSERALDEATEVIHSLIDRETLSDAEQDYLDVLTDLVEAYESVHYPEEPVSDAQMLRFLIEMKGVTQAEAAKGAGIAESTISEVLSGKRKLNRTQIGKLARYFHVEPGAFEFGSH